MTPDTQHKEPKHHELAWWQQMFRFLLPLLVLGVAGMIAKKIVDSKKKQPRTKPPKMAVRVETIKVHKMDHQVSLHGMGAVIPARTVDLQSQVAGNIIHLHQNLEQGAPLQAGTTVVELDDSDYQIALRDKEIQLMKARADLELELGQQIVAKREWELLNNGKAAKPNELALRVPQLKIAEANIAAAENALQKAKLDLARTKVTTPFNAVVKEKLVELGSQISAQSRLASLIGTDEFWIKVTVPTDRLEWIDIPAFNAKEGSEVIIPEVNRKGRVLRLLSDLESGGRMAQLLITVKNPLMKQEGSSVLLLNSYVSVKIAGRKLKDVYRVPRVALRDGNSVWVADADETLQSRKVHAIWRDETHVILRDGLTDSDAVITSELTTPVMGMPVITQNVPKNENKTVTKKKPQSITSGGEAQ